MDPIGILESLIRMVRESGWSDGDPNREWQLNASETALRSIQMVLEQLGCELVLIAGENGLELMVTRYNPQHDELEEVWG